MSKRWRRWVRELRETFPPPDGERVRIVRNLPRAVPGETKHSPSGITTIYIDSRAPDLFAWWILVHEWSHLFAWEGEIDHSDCGQPCKHWGCWHARIWREHHHDGDHWAD